MKMADFKPEHFNWRAESRIARSLLAGTG